MNVILNKKIIYNDVKIANSFLKRLKGLLGKKYLNDGQGLLIFPCNQVHSFFMQFPIDVIYLTDNMRILNITTLEPGKVDKIVKSAKMVLEVKQGTTAQLGLKIGDNLVLG